MHPASRATDRSNHDDSASPHQCGNDRRADSEHISAELDREALPRIVRLRSYNMGFNFLMLPYPDQISSSEPFQLSKS